MSVRFLLILLIAACAWGAEPEALSKARREVVVKWRHMPATLDAEALNLPAGAVAVRKALPVTERTASGIERLTVITAASDADQQTLLNSLRSDPRVDYAEPLLMRYTDGMPVEPERRERGGGLDGVPDDPFYSLQWYMPLIEAEAAWNITRGDPDVVIAVVDLGVDFSHPELAGKQWINEAEATGTSGVDDDGNGFIDDVNGWDAMDNDPDPTPSPYQPSESHGTHVAGLAAAARNNSQGIAGLAPDCRIMSVRVGTLSHVPYGYEGIYYACRAGAKVINCSWGGSGDAAYERDVARYAIEQGCVIVAAAGNGATFIPHYPAALEGVVSVAASAQGDRAADFTHYGSWVKISAPGVSMIAPIIGENGAHPYDNYQGTSMSAPLVSAACALVASRYPALSARAIAERVASSSDPIDSYNPNQAGQLGLGRLNVWRALTDSVAGVRICGTEFFELIGDEDGRVEAGETAEIRIAVCNDLSGITSIIGRVMAGDTRIQITNPLLFYGSVPPGGPTWSTTGITVTLPVDIEPDFVLPLVVDWVDEQQRLIGRGRADIYLDPTFVSVDNGRLELGFAENGSLGYSDYLRDLYLGPGLRISDYSNALYHGTFLLAADGAVSDNGYGDADFNRFDWAAVPDSFAQFVPTPRADIEARAIFEDRQAEQILFARVSAAALAWRDAERDQFFILEYQVTNRSVNPWHEAWAGFFLDWDLGSASGNIAAYDSESGVAYVRQVAPQHALVGIAGITDPWGALNIIDNRTEIDPAGAWNDARKWELLHEGLETGPIGPRDISFLIAAGPFALNPQAVRTFAYAIVVGETLDELRALAALAREEYIGRAMPSTGPQPQPAIPAGFYPNPLPVGAPLHLIVPQTERMTVTFYNILGQQIAVLPDFEAGPAGRVIDRQVLGGASGLLFYRLDSATRSSSGKLLLLK